MSRKTGMAGNADGMSGSTDDSGAYYCGWAVTGRATVAHLVASAVFPIAGRKYLSWCGETITVIALTLDARGLPRSCTDCNQQLRLLALAQRVR